jgi:hypothetical protein
MGRTRFEAAMDKKAARNEAESRGEVADSMQVRLALMERVNKGEITLEEAQKQLRKIKANAKKNGLVTRSQAYNAG